ncbi:hypothetical protein A2886_01500 [candidate division WWE3 bacterium RIFCSPHIGHO2_01_FULL_42_13]|uniref:Uncharacterized protein n=1 Tax=candidate division WWE3 bacterium RIFCSPHIGHO2_01_FULL_42_13 TaxID=1802617 RepID=A0A1F4USI8_UNCKA|nr:MAG: hypothetical protein A2886_01500 [candidate division WWE3 bacterium RIFCSPHIGHO2_01_FULL_42_13]
MFTFEYMHVLYGVEAAQVMLGYFVQLPMGTFLIVDGVYEDKTLEANPAKASPTASDTVLQAVFYVEEPAAKP